MNNTVKLLLQNTNFQFICNDEQVAQIYEWLRACDTRCFTLSHERRPAFFGSTASGSDPFENVITIVFSNPRDAAEFKLTWGDV